MELFHEHVDVIVLCMKYITLKGSLSSCKHSPASNSSPVAPMHLSLRLYEIFYNKDILQWLSTARPIISLYFGRIFDSPNMYFSLLANFTIHLSYSFEKPGKNAKAFSISLTVSYTHIRAKH